MVKQESFAQALAAGLLPSAAYVKAGYRPGNPKIQSVCAAQLKRRIWPRVEYLLQRRSMSQEVATVRAVERMAIRKETVARELLKTATGTIDHFVKFTSAGDPYFDIASATPEQRAAIQEMTIEEFKDGRGEDARDVRWVKIKLYNPAHARRSRGPARGAVNCDRRRVRGTRRNRGWSLEPLVP